MCVFIVCSCVLTLTLTVALLSVSLKRLYNDKTHASLFDTSAQHLQNQNNAVFPYILHPVYSCVWKHFFYFMRNFLKTIAKKQPPGLQGIGKEYHTYPWRGLVGYSSPLRPYVDKTLKSVTHGQCNARPTVTFPVARHRCPATDTKLYRERHMFVNNLPMIVTWQWNGRKLNSWPLESQANALTITSPGHISLQLL